MSLRWLVLVCVLKLRSEHTPPSFEEIVTHSVGTARTALLETVPDWDELLPILTSCSRSPQLKSMLADLYSGSAPRWRLSSIDRLVD